MNSLHYASPQNDGRRAADRSSFGQFAASIVLPGSAALRRRPAVGVSLLLIGVILPAALVTYLAMRRSEIIGVALDPRFLLVAVAVGTLSVVARFAAIAEVALDFRSTPAIGAKTVIAAVVVTALSAPVLWGVVQTADARSTLGSVFSAESAQPLYTPAPSGDGVDPTAVTNILVIGGDAGPGRWGMRSDTMILASIHEASGRMALTSIPRNLTSLQFPPGSPLALEFPNGFDDLANALFTHVNTDPALMAHYGASGQQAEAMALVEALGYSLDVQIDDFALVNMQGFTEVIDAVGGVTLELGEVVPLPPSIANERPLPPSVGPGVVDMDGALAIAFARSRSADSDYQRMGRQRQLLAAVGSQISATDALGAFSTVSGVLDDSMRTSLSAGEFDQLLGRLGDNSAVRESVGLTPPLIQPGSPDYGQIRAIIDAVQLGLISDQPSGFAS